MFFRIVFSSSRSLFNFVLALLDPRLAGEDLPRAAIAAILEIGQLLRMRCRVRRTSRLTVGDRHGIFAQLKGCKNKASRGGTHHGSQNMPGKPMPYCRQDNRQRDNNRRNGRDERPPSLPAPLPGTGEGGQWLMRPVRESPPTAGYVRGVATS